MARVEEAREYLWRMEPIASQRAQDVQDTTGAVDDEWAADASASTARRIRRASARTPTPTRPIKRGVPMRARLQSMDDEDTTPDRVMFKPASLGRR